MAIKKIEKQGSVTFQLSENRKTAIEEMAYRLGLRRIAEQKERGNTSALLNLVVEFVFENKALFAQWLTERVMK